MSKVEAELLQQQITNVLRRRKCKNTIIELDCDADVLDLIRHAEILVTDSERSKRRLFTVKTVDDIQRHLADMSVAARATVKYASAHYVAGNPLCIVESVTAESIVDAVLHYLCIESHGDCHG